MRSPAALALLLGVLAAQHASAQEEQRFDVQAFRPLGGHEDLVTVGQSRPLGNLKLSGGLFFNLSLNPLVLVTSGTHSTAVGVVSNRLQLDAMAAVGILDWVELGVDMPLVLAQASDNLEAIGTEGYIHSFVPGDLRFNAKVAIPGLRRKVEGSGFGASLTLGMGLPTGSQEDFASDGAMTWSPGLILDYRFEGGILLALNTGLWFRPPFQFAGVQWGNAATFGLGAEVPLLRRSHVTAVGMFAGSTPLEKFPESPRQIPAEVLFGLRWYSPLGFTLTVGGGGGCGCSLTSPTLRVFTSLLWVPFDDNSERFKEPPEPPRPVPSIDPDGDSVIGEGDRCPTVAGPVENGGCPDSDTDHDGVVDRLDRCPAFPMGPKGRDGCPLARIEGNKIVILDQVYFLTDQDIIMPDSTSILDEVAGQLLEHQEIQRVLVEAHTDSRATDAYNFDLSRRRALSVMNFLLDSGVAVERLCSAGFGRSRPLVSNDSDENMALNRRVEFTLLPPGTPCPVDPSLSQGKPTKGKPAPPGSRARAQRGGRTSKTTSAAALRLPAVAVTTVRPGPTAVTCPVEDTVATDQSELNHVTGTSEMAMLRLLNVRARNVCVCPARANTRCVGSTSTRAKSERTTCTCSVRLSGGTVAVMVTRPGATPISRPFST